MRRAGAGRGAGTISVQIRIRAGPGGARGLPGFQHDGILQVAVTSRVEREQDAAMSDVRTPLVQRGRTEAGSQAGVDGSDVGRGRGTPVGPESGKKIKVLHLLHTMAYGGIETVLLNWLENFDRRRFEIRVVCFANPGGGGSERPFVEAAGRRGIEVQKIPWGKHKPLLTAALALRALVREHDIDVLHMHGWYAEFVGALTARLIRVKTINTVYVWFDYDWKRNVLQWIDKYVMRLFDQISAHCHFTYQETVARGIAAARIKTLICGFQGERYEEAAGARLARRQAAGIGDGEVLLLNVARLYPEKAQEALLEIFANLYRDYPNLKLWIAGTGPLEGALRDQAARLGLGEVVTFQGFVDDLPPLLSLADIQVHPAAIEGVPLAVLSGMDAGLPIVASKVGGIPEILDNGQSGILVPPGDDGAFVKAVARLVENPIERKAYGDRAQKFVREEYALDRAVRRVEETYLELVGGDS